MTPNLDTDFDFRSDTPPNKDPDRYSARLREYHQILWSKPLPCGTKFQLTRSTGHAYLEHRSELGSFSVSSDSVIPAYRKYREVAGFIRTIPDEQICEFQRLGYTIGGMMIFPSNRIGGKKTINAERGLNRYIRDRFDLTVECIKRHYEGVSSPLSDTLSRYASFFALFESFRGYIDFFLLQDIVSHDYSSVRFSLPFTGFDGSPIPGSADAYGAYKSSAMNFISARNVRISRYEAS